MFLFTLLGTFAQAADEPAAALAQRERIQQERDQAQTQFGSRAAQCHQVFGVNECLAQANRARREVLADLRRQELSLNGAQARRNASDQMSSTEKKSSVQTLSERDADRTAARELAQQHQQEIEEKREQQAARATQIPQRQDEASQRLSQKAQAQADAKARQDAAPSERKRYEEKMQAAQKRQNERENRLLELKKSANPQP